MKQLFAYIRVSDTKQKTGVSLIEQRSIIDRYAARIGADISQWFEETRTAAKAGRPVFTRMLSLLRAGKAEGVIIHKLDRGTRNFRDWAEINDLIEDGIEVHVANDNLDLRSRGGRLAADVQIAVAVDYIRNLREEALKGIEGRLKQGILPNHVGIGYLDRGKGKAKEIDPQKGPLVKRLFERYATGSLTLRDLAAEAEQLGLRTRSGRPLRKQEIHIVLRNPFYSGIIRSKRFGDFDGAHVPLVTRALFDRVQEVLDGKFVRRTKRFTFLFRRFLRCKTCGRALIGSERKGRIYYRCSNIPCPTTSVREDRVEDAVRDILRQATLSHQDTLLVKEELARNAGDETSLRQARAASLGEALRAVTARISRLTDLLIDGKIEAPAHDEKRASLLAERQRLEQEVSALESGDADLMLRAERVVELARCPETLYAQADPIRKRELLEIVLSNATVTGKEVEFALHEPFATIARGRSQQSSGQFYDTPRTFSAAELVRLVADLPQKLADALQKLEIRDTEDSPP